MSRLPKKSRFRTGFRSGITEWLIITPKSCKHRLVLLQLGSFSHPARSNSRIGPIEYAVVCRQSELACIGNPIFGVISHRAGRGHVEVLIRHRSRPKDAILRYYCSLASLLMARSSSWDGRLMSSIQTRVVRGCYPIPSARCRSGSSTSKTQTTSQWRAATAQANVTWDVLFHVSFVDLVIHYHMTSQAWWLS